MGSGRRIDFSLLDSEMQTLINASAKIFPHSYTDIQSNLNPDNHPYARVTTEGEHYNEIYRWNSTNSVWELIGADDRSIDWTDVKNKPTEYNPTEHYHDDRYYTETEINNLLLNYSQTNHTHTDLHTHVNKTLLDILTYTGALQSIDLIEIENLQTNKADTGHLHDDRYYTETEINNLLSNKSDIGHDHDGRYYTESEINTLLSGKANTFTNRTVLDKITEVISYESYDLSMLQDHEDRIWAIENGYTEGHTHSNLTALDLIAYSGSLLTIDLIEIENLQTNKADVGHLHDDRYYTESEINSLLSGKSDTGHLHDDRYYTETEIDNLLANYALTTHNHDSIYSPIGHNHDTVYSPLAHDHDGRYYTESEINGLLSNKSDVGHTHSNYASGEKVSTTASTGWLRIAQGGSSCAQNVALFRIQVSKSGKHNSILFSASVTYGQEPVITVLNNSTYGGGGISKIRLLSYSTYDQPYIEVYITDASVAINVEMIGSYGWDLITPIAGSIPSGYSSLEVNLTTNRGIITTDNIYVNGTAVSLSNHNHDSRYYTESEINSLLGNKANASGFSTITVSSIAPSSPAVNDIWIDTSA